MSTTYIINRISSHFSHFWVCSLSSFERNELLTCSFLHPDPWDMEKILFWEWIFFSVIFSLLMTSSLRHLAVFCAKMSIFHPLTRHRMAQHTSLVPKFVSGGRPNWRLHELISKMSYQPLLWRHFRRFLADFWPKRPKSSKSGVDPHEPIETAVDRMKNLMADLESLLNFASSYIYTFTGLDIKANILASGM